MGEAPLVVVMGISGVGKSAIGHELADRFSVDYADGDDFHSEANIAKMSAGTPLTDEDRWPWLADIGGWLHEHDASGGVISCSALNRAYRDVLVHGRSDVRIVFLNGTQELIAGRLAARKGHFMPPGLLTSQFKTLEPPQPTERPITVSIDAPVEAIVDAIIRQLNRTPE